MDLQVTATPATAYALTNCVYVSPNAFNLLLKLFRPENRPSKADAGILCLIQTTSLTGSLNTQVVYKVKAANDPKINDQQLAMNGLHREFQRLQLDAFVKVMPFLGPMNPKEAENYIMTSGKLSISMIGKPKAGTQVEVDCEEFSHEIKQVLGGHVFVVGQKMNHKYKSSIFLCIELLSFETVGNDQRIKLALSNRGQLVGSTTFTFEKAPGDPSLKLRNNINGSVTTGSATAATRLVGVDFEKLGIGGLDKEFVEIFRRAFASRIYPPEIVNKLGTKHVKGLMLYGPPGCGKTLIARQLSKQLQGSGGSGGEYPAPEPKVVSGPEILNKYVGGSEEKVRELFKDAERDEATLGEDSPLHVLIFDEIDAICRQRGSTRDGTGVGDSVVNQLLAKIDGVNSLNNVLLIGMTNRLDMIDTALLRPGRFEVHIEIGLPDVEGRKQILRIHTSRMRESNSLSTDVNIEELADETKNFTGAELEGLVKSAQSFAFLRHSNNQRAGRTSNINDLKIEAEDFFKALKEVKPAFGVNKEEELQVHFRHGILEFNESFLFMKESILALADEVKGSEVSTVRSVLLSGVNGSGKSAFAASIAVESGFPFVKFINLEPFIGLSEQARCSKLAGMFDDAYKSPLSMIILDNIEQLIDYVAIGPRFSNSMLQTLLFYINKQPPKDNRNLFILATSSLTDMLRDLQIASVFDNKLVLPLLTQDKDIASVLEAVLGDNITSVVIKELSAAVRKPIPIKKILQVARTAKIKAAREANGTVSFDIFMEVYTQSGAAPDVI